MAAVVDEIGILSQYLCVSCNQVNKKDQNDIPQIKMKNGGTLKGLSSIAKYLVRQSKHKNLLGDTPEEEAKISQWLEYRFTHVSRCEEEKDVLNILQDLDSYLSDKVYFVACQLTLADLLVYYGLYPIMNHLTFHQKQKFMNVSRWFDNVQHQPQVRQKLNELHFSKTLLYTGPGH